MLMNLKGLCWDRDLLSLFDVPEAMLPRIVSSRGESWSAVKVLPGVPIAGVLGDHQAALFGQTGFDRGRPSAHTAPAPVSCSRPGPT